MTIIEQIKAEIERRLKKYATDVTMPLEVLGKVIFELKDLLSFLSTLESEKPVPNDLDFEQELYNRFGQIKDFTLGMRIGQYFYNLGIDSVPLPEDTVLFNKGVEEGKRLMMDEWLKDRDGCFWDGVEEGKKAMEEQMMKEAVEGEVCIPNVWVEHKEGKELVVRAEISKELGLKFGDKVRIFIVKED